MTVPRNLKIVKFELVRTFSTTRLFCNDFHCFIANGCRNGEVVSEVVLPDTLFNSPCMNWFRLFPKWVWLISWNPVHSQLICSLLLRISGEGSAHFTPDFTPDFAPDFTPGFRHPCFFPLSLKMFSILSKSTNSDKWSSSARLRMEMFGRIGDPRFVFKKLTYS